MAFRDFLTVLGGALPTRMCQLLLLQFRWFVFLWCFLLVGDIVCVVSSCWLLDGDTSVEQTVWDILLIHIFLLLCGFSGSCALFKRRIEAFKALGLFIRA